jgi:hypothetical protein
VPTPNPAFQPADNSFFESSIPKADLKSLFALIKVKPANASKYGKKYSATWGEFA